MLETTCLIMEALAAPELQGRYEYAIVGHSGETEGEPFVEFANPPKDRGERLKVLQRMVAHSQFCMAGDNTVEATARAVRGLARDAKAAAGADAEESGDGTARNFVFVLSDANFKRYGMDPLWWSEALTSEDETVEGYAVMVGSLGDEALTIAGALPRGRAYVCADADDIPKTFADIFRHARIVEDDSF